MIWFHKIFHFSKKANFLTCHYKRIKHTKKNYLRTLHPFTLPARSMIAAHRRKFCWRSCWTLSWPTAISARWPILCIRRRRKSWRTSGPSENIFWWKKWKINQLFVNNLWDKITKKNAKNLIQKCGKPKKNTHNNWAVFGEGKGEHFQRIEIETSQVWVLRSSMTTSTQMMKTKTCRSFRYRSTTICHFCRCHSLNFSI